jgi:hypothetical protein
VAKDPIAAFVWFGLAWSKGVGPARAELARLAATMTPADIEEAQKRQIEWRRAHK